MRKLLATAMGALLLAPAAPAPAHETGQEVLETVVGPPLPAKNVSRVGRSLVIISQMQGVNGLGGYYFEPNSDTIGAPFVLKPAGARDVDVFFYEDLGNLVDIGPMIVGEHTTESIDGEKGFVPVGTKYVVVYYGTCATGCPSPTVPPALVSFLYRAEKTPVVTIDGTSLDLGHTEVHAGGMVALNNTSAEPITLRSTAVGSDGATPLFEYSEPFTGRVLFDLSYMEVGEYGFTIGGETEGTIAII